MPTWSQQAFDNFNRGDESPLSGGGNWSTMSGVQGCHLYSLRWTGDLDTWYTESFSNRAETLNDNQRTRFDIQGGFGNLGVTCRVTGQKAYVWWIDNTSVKKGRIYLYDTGSWTQIGSDGTLSGSTVQVDFYVVGTALEGWTGLTKKAEGTDSTLSSGKAGVYGLAPGSRHYGDNFYSYHDTDAPAGQPAIQRWGGVPYMTVGGRKW